MSSVNKVILIGTLGKDAEVRNLQGGSIVASVTMATNDSYTDKNGEKVNSTEWHNVEFWNKSAEVVSKYTKKGSQIYVEGKLKTEKYDKDGVTHYRTKITATTLQLLDKKPAGENGGSTQQSTAPAQQGYNQNAPQGNFNAPAPQQGYNQNAPQGNFNSPAPQGYPQNAPQGHFNAPAPQQYPQNVPQGNFNTPAPQQGYNQNAPQGNFNSPAPQQGYNQNMVTIGNEAFGSPADDLPF